MSEFNPKLRQARATTRRTFFGQAGMGLGALALGTLLEQGSRAENPKPEFRNPKSGNPLAPNFPMLPARAKSIIYLHASGAPPTLDLFDFKPKLVELNMKPCPDSLLKGERFAFIKGVPKMLGTPHKFSKHGQNQTWVCDLLPGMASIIDETTLIRSMVTDQFNHAPAELFLYTGSA